MKRSRPRRAVQSQPSSRSQKQAGAVPGEKSPGRRGGKGTGRVLERDPPHSHTEWEQRLKGLQLPAACSFVLGLVERYLRSVSRPDTSSSLPSRETLLLLIDRFILKIPSSSSSLCGKEKDANMKGGLGMFKMSDTSLNIFEELQLLDSLRIQLEERQSRGMQHALFDAMFSYQEDETPDQRQQLVQKLTSLAISLGSSSILGSAAFWMELYPAGGRQLAQHLYYEFCYLLPAAIEPMRQLSSLSPAMVRQLLVAFTDLYPMHMVSQKREGSKSSDNSVQLSPPLPLVELVSHWVTATNPSLLLTSSPSSIAELNETPLLRYNRTKPIVPMSPLSGLVQWCILEPLLTEETISSIIGKKREKEPKGVEDYRSLVSKIHADLLGILLSLATLTHGMLASDDVAHLVASLVSFARIHKSDQGMEAAVDRLAQFLQIGLSAGAVVLRQDELGSISSTLPHNRLLSIVISKHTQQN